MTGPGVPANVLVAFASRHGSTEEIAERLARRLHDSGACAEVRRVNDAGNIDAYDAVVLGSPVYDQCWAPEALEFVERNVDTLAKRPVWLFSVGSIGDSSPVWGRFATKEPKQIGALQTALHSRAYRVFAGVIERDRWPFASRLFFRLLGGRLGDNRNWPEIEAWADEIARALRNSESE